MKMRNIKLNKWIKFFIGVAAIVVFTILLPYFAPDEQMKMNQEKDIDAGALFYSESPQALKSAYQIQKGNY